MLSSILSSIWIELPAWFLLAFGFYIALRILRFPDLTVEATFVAGGVGAACGAAAFASSLVGLVVALLLGAVAGALTSMLYALHQTPLFKLLAGLLILFAFYSINFRVLGLRTDLGFTSSATAFNRIIDWEAAWGFNKWRPLSTLLLYFICLLVVFAVRRFFRSERGMIIRTLGYRPEIVANCGLRPMAWLAASLIGVNLIVAIGGWIYATGNANVSLTDFGYVLHALAAVILGELTLKLLSSRLGRISPLRALVVAPLLGSVLYTLIRAFVMYIVTSSFGVAGGSQIWMPIKQDLNIVFGCILAFVLMAVRAFSTRWTALEVGEVDEL